MLFIYKLASMTMFQQPDRITMVYGGSGEVRRSRRSRPQITVHRADLSIVKHQVLAGGGHSRARRRPALCQRRASCVDFDCRPQGCTRDKERPT
jgi:hypothetical protein